MYLPVASGMYSVICSVTNSSFSSQEKTVRTVRANKLKRSVDKILIKGFSVFTDTNFQLRWYKTTNKKRGNIASPFKNVLFMALLPENQLVVISLVSLARLTD